VALALDKSSIPWNTSWMLCQTGIELAVSRTIKSHALVLAIFAALISIEEPVKNNSQSNPFVNFIMAID
jgi:hypothetical protein